MGQEFHMRHNQVQYCFGEACLVEEQMPLEVHALTDKSPTLCSQSGLTGSPTREKELLGLRFVRKATMILTD